MYSNSFLFEKKEQFRKEIRKQRNETLFKQKRVIQNQKPMCEGSLDQLKFKLKKQEYCDDLLEWFSQIDNPVNIFKELLEFLESAISLSTVQIGLKCINNLLYYYDDIFGLQDDCYDFLHKSFQIDDFTVKSRSLQCLGNLLHDYHGYEIDAQNHFFKVDLLPQFIEEYSFLIHVLAQYSQFQDLIKCMQFLEDIIINNPNGTALEATKLIFEKCTPLEADDLVENHFKNPILKLINLAASNKVAFNALLSLLYRVNDATKVSLFVLGYNNLIKIYLDNPNLRGFAYQLISPFTCIIDQADDINQLIQYIFSLFEDHKLHYLLIEDCDPEKLLIICNSIKNGNIQIFIDFLDHNIIEKIFVPYLLSEDYYTVSIILETIDELFQRDELTSNQFAFIVQAFNTEQFKSALEKKYYDKDVQKQDQINKNIDSILGVILN